MELAVVIDVDAAAVGGSCPNSVSSQVPLGAVLPPLVRVVLSCLFDGEHGNWPALGLIEVLAWWFFSS